MPRKSNQQLQIEKIEKYKKAKALKYKSKYHLTKGQIEDLVNGFEIEIDIYLGELLILQWFEDVCKFKKTYKSKPIRGDYMGNSEDSEDEC